MSLDRSDTPQYHEALGKDNDGEWIFADPTTLTVTAGSVMRIGDRARVLVNDDSSLIFEPGSRLLLGKRARIIIARNATLVLPEDVETELDKKARILRK